MGETQTRPLALLVLLALAVPLCACGRSESFFSRRGEEPVDGYDDDTEPDDDSDTVPPLTSCDIDLLFTFDTSISMMTTLGALSQEGFAGFVNLLSSYPQPGTIRVGITNHLYGEHWMENQGAGALVQTSAFLTEGMSNAGEIGDCFLIPSVDCDFASGEAWMNGPSPTLAGEFNCVGKLPCQEVIGGPSGGGIEPTLQAGYEALIHPINDGFIREEALLFVVFVTDEDDQSELDLDSIRTGLLALKQSDPDFVFVAAMAGSPTATCDSELLGDDTEPTPRIAEFIELFGPHGRYFNMCDTSAQAALSSISSLFWQACPEVDDGGP